MSRRPYRYRRLMRSLAEGAVDAAALVYRAARWAVPRLLEFGGYAAVTYGCWMAAEWVGWVVGGVLAVQSGVRRG